MKKIAFFNVAELKKYQDGYILYRYPSDVIRTLGYHENVKGRVKAKLPTMCEMRFHTEETSFQMTFKALDADSHIHLYVEGFQSSSIPLKKGKKEKITFTLHPRFVEHHKDVSDQDGYDIRFIFDNSSRIVCYDVDQEDIVEEKNLPYVLYGSSISQGIGAHDIFHSYAFQLQQRLNVDILNKGLSGSCLLERKAIRYLSSLPCKGYILEIGCNVRGVMETEEFEKRFSYLINTLVKAHPKEPIFVINILDMFENLYKDFKDIPYHQKNLEIIRIIQEKIHKKRKKNLYLISGKNLIENIYGISGDLLHPSDIGHEEMSIKLAKIIKEILKED